MMVVVGLMAITTAVLVSGASDSGAPGLDRPPGLVTPGIIHVLPPDLGPVIVQPDDPGAIPTGPSRCEVAIRSLTTLTSSCSNILASDADLHHWCQDSDGCRKMMIESITALDSACIAAETLHAVIGSVLDQIAYLTATTCPETDESCDVQSTLVMAMLDFPANRTLQCTPCVKKSFGRMSLSEFDSVRLLGNIGKTRCNKIQGQFLHVTQSPTTADLCEEWHQRSISKVLSASRLQNVEERADRILRACYDDGTGTSCFNKTASILTDFHRVVMNKFGRFEQRGELDICSDDSACQNPKCVSLLRTLMQQAGCCTPTLPMLLLNNLHLPCLEPMIERVGGQMSRTCNDPVKFYVHITVQTSDSVENICQAVQQDLATTLAMLPEMIECDKDDSVGPNTEGYLTVRATVNRIPSIGMSSSLAFDPDILQDPVVHVETCHHDN